MHRKECLLLIKVRVAEVRLDQLQHDRHGVYLHLNSLPAIRTAEPNETWKCQRQLQQKAKCFLGAQNTGEMVAL